MSQCLFCKNETQNPKFCSRSCAASYTNRTNPKRHLKGKCKICQSLISSTRTYCDTCWNINKSQTYTRNTKPLSKLCPNCKICIPNYKNFCCAKCSEEYRFKQRVSLIEQSGIIYPDTKFNTSASFAKRYLKYKFGDKCSICNQPSIWNNLTLVLILDHINGKSNDWSINNIRLVCPNCDTQLSTFKSKNNGQGRPRKYYTNI